MLSGEYHVATVAAEHFCLSAREAEEKRKRRGFVFGRHRVRAPHVEVELEIFRYGDVILGEDHRDVSLRLPQVDAVVEVGTQLVFVFEYGSFPDGRYREFELHVLFVDAFREDQVALHLGAYHLSAFHIVGRSVKLADAFFQCDDGIAFVGVVGNPDVGIGRSFGFKYFDFDLIVVEDAEIVG